MKTFKEYFNKKLMFESFVDSKNKWIRQGIDPTEVELAIDFYRGLKTRNIIKGPETDIGFWMSKSFEEFKTFIDQFKNVKTKTQVKTEIGNDAETVFENDRAIVIVPKTHQASCKYGAGTKWCTTSKESSHWNQYIMQNVRFYYILTKDKPNTDPLYKVAVAVYLGGRKEVYNATDDNMADDELDVFIRDYNIPENIFINSVDPIKHLNKYDHTIDNDGFITVNEDFGCSGEGLTKLPWKFKEVKGYFDCSGNRLTTLKGAPKIIDGSFYCYGNKLITLKGAPKTVEGDFNCHYNELTTLDYLPEIGGKLYFDHNPLLPEEIALYNL